VVRTISIEFMLGDGVTRVTAQNIVRRDWALRSSCSRRKYWERIDNSPAGKRSDRHISCLLGMSDGLASTRGTLFSIRLTVYEGT